MNGCEECPGIAAGAVARTMTTVIVALASVIVMALAGCANPWGGSRMSQARDGRRFLAQAPFQKSALKV